MYKLRRAGVPIHYRRVVTKALGDGELQRVTHAPVDADWYPDRDREETIEADTLCVHYGLQPRSYLAQLAGCDLVFSEQKQAWTLVHDEYMRTSHEDILAAGDGSDIAGAITAEHEGRIAGLEVARQLGRIDSPTFTTKYRSHADQIKKLAPFQNTLSRICRIRPGLTTLMEDDTIVCRCEEVRWGDAKAAIEHGGTSFRTLKVMTRLGMGMCQARFCWPAMSRTLAEHKGCSVGEIGLARPQAPVLPVSLGVIAAMPESDKTGNT
jgi:NADPH-dependent 2,4-dienoyl-CoA reductase/sulfur reductase-like enzyme